MFSSSVRGKKKKKKEEIDELLILNYHYFIHVVFSQENIIVWFDLLCILVCLLACTLECISIRKITIIK